MSMFKQFKTDSELEKNGVIVDYGDFRITLARAGGANKKFGKLLEAKTKPFKRAIQTETMDNERALDIVKEVYAEAVILKWETKVTEKGKEVFKDGIEDPNDETKLIPATKENILMVFKLLPDLFSEIQEQAQKTALYREIVREEDAKNS